MKTDIHTYSIEIQKRVREILKIELEERMRIIYLVLLKSMQQIPKERVKISLEEYLVKGILEDLE